MSPDGRATALSINDNLSGQMKAVIRSDSGLETILDISPTRVFKWTPDGSGLVYQERLRGDNLTSKIYQVDPLKPVPRLLISTEPDEVYDFSISRDGRRFAVVRVRIVSDAVMLSALNPESSR
jgi:hypothetical protein